MMPSFLPGYPGLGSRLLGESIAAGEGKADLCLSGWRPIEYCARTVKVYRPDLSKRKAEVELFDCAFGGAWIG